MSRYIAYIGLLLILVTVPANSGGQHRGDCTIPEGRIADGIDLIVMGEYGRAEEYIREKFEGDPMTAGFMTVSLQYAKMGELESTAGSEMFSDASENLIDLAKTRLSENPRDIKALFYRGTVQEYRAVHFSRMGKYLKALTTARSGIKDIEKCRDIEPDFKDVHLALGSYRYWKSAKNFLKILPGIPDNRDKAILQIKDNLSPGSVSYALGLNQLVWILIDAKRYSEAEDCALEGLETYPGSRFYMYPLAVMYYRQGDWFKAANYYRKTSESLLNGGFGNRAMYGKTLLKYAECLAKTGDKNSAVDICRQLSTLDVIEPDYDKYMKLRESAGELIESIETSG